MQSGYGKWERRVREPGQQREIALPQNFAAFCTFYWGFWKYFSGFREASKLPKAWAGQARSYTDEQGRSTAMKFLAVICACLRLF